MSCCRKSVVALVKVLLLEALCTLRCWTCAGNACWHWMWQGPCLAVICGRWFWTKFHPSQAFSWLYPTILHARLVLNETLQQQGLGGERPKVSGTYVPINLHAAWLFAQGQTVADEEFSLVGITEVTWVGDQTPALLQNLPNSLRHLSFDETFNESLQIVTLPAGLQSLTFGYQFNRSLDNVTWPAGLQSLTFGYHFNQSLDNVTWPAGLQSLTFGGNFNRSLDNVTWPASLQTLAFGGDFCQSLENVKLPAGLQSLTCGGRFNQSLDNWSWPAGLQSF